MKNDFICPKCRAYMNVGDNIVFSVKNRAGYFGLVLLSPDVGDYRVVTHPQFPVEEGALYDFFCSACHAKLNSRVHERLASVLMIDLEGKENEILFSRIAGEKCTYKIVDDSVESHGEDSSSYLDFVSMVLTK